MQDPQEMQVWSLDQEDPLEEEIATNSHILVWKKSHEQRSLDSYSPWGHKESDMAKNAHTELLTMSWSLELFHPALTETLYPLISI